MTYSLPAVFLLCFLIALASSSISITISQTELFASLRAWIKGKSTLLGQLFECFYCLSHWVVFSCVLIYKPRLLNSNFIIIDWLMTAFVIITVTTFVSGIIFKVFQTATAAHLIKIQTENAS